MADGGAIEINCDGREVVLKGKVQAEGKGEYVETKFTECEAFDGTKLCGYTSSVGQPNGTIALEPDLPTRLVEKEGVLYNEVQSNATSKRIADLKIEAKAGSEKPCGPLKITNQLSGSILEKVTNEAYFSGFKLVELLGEGKSGATELKLDSFEAKFLVNNYIMLENGDELRAS